MAELIERVCETLNDGVDRAGFETPVRFDTVYCSHFECDEDGRQIAHARVVGDGVAFGYVGDVFVVPEARGRGVGKALMQAVLAHPHVRDLKRLALVTDDAHDLYEQFGFAPLDDVRKWMQRRR